MGDICELILEQHHDMRRRFAELDVYLGDAEPDEQVLSRVWETLHQLMDAHAEAEEILFYPLLLRAAVDPDIDSDTRDAISDHNKIRDEAAKTADIPVGSSEWWSVVLQARENNSTHMAEEEQGPLRIARTTADRHTRLHVGSHWEAFMTGRLHKLAEDSHDKDPAGYVAAHLRSDE